MSTPIMYTHKFLKAYILTTTYVFIQILDSELIWLIKT